jgi:uncharacterized Zn finger protein
MEQEQQMRVDINQTTPVVCECGNKLFQEVLMIRKVSRFVSRAPMDQTIPVALIACTKCGELHTDSIPPALKVVLDKEKENV